jgi:glutathione reductase (NADPH)
VLKRLPEHIVLIGDGYSAFEFEHIAACAGTDVTTLHQGDQPLEEFDPNMVNLLADHTRRLGVNIHVGTR